MVIPLPTEFSEEPLILPTDSLVNHFFLRFWIVKWLLRGYWCTNLYHEKQSDKGGKCDLSNFLVGSFSDRASRSEENLNCIFYFHLIRWKRPGRFFWLGFVSCLILEYLPINDEVMEDADNLSCQRYDSDFSSVPALNPEIELLQLWISFCSWCSMCNSISILLTWGEPSLAEWPVISSPPFAY